MYRNVWTGTINFLSNNQFKALSHKQWFQIYTSMYLRKQDSGITVLYRETLDTHEQIM